MSGPNALQVDELVRIAAAGGGFRLDAKAHHVNDLVRIAAAAADSRHGARLALANAWERPVNDLVRIAAAGNGAVFFE